MDDFWQDLGALTLTAGLTADGTLKPASQWPTELASKLEWLKWGSSSTDAALSGSLFVMDQAAHETGAEGESFFSTVWFTSASKSAKAAGKTGKAVYRTVKAWRAHRQSLGFVKTRARANAVWARPGRASKCLHKVSKWASKNLGKVLLALDIGLTWGGFLYEVLTTPGMGAFSPAFNALLARAIAATILSIILFVIGTSVVGSMIVALFAVIDVLFYLIFGFSIQNWLTEQLDKAIYTFEITVDLDVGMAPLETGLSQPGLGLSARNTLAASTQVTTTAWHKGPDNWRLYLPWYRALFYNEGSLRATTVKYTLKPAKEAVSASRNEMRHDWAVARQSTFKYWGTAPTARLETRSQLTAGINQHIPVYLNTGYALPAAECWTLWIPTVIVFIWLPIPVCYNRTFSSHTSSDMSLTVDVFPASLDEFYTLQATGDGGLRLGWDDDFAALMDADGDGLLSPAHAGPDPDDGQWDTDGDGLSDAYELKLREAGTPADPHDPDTDDDGLSDAQEIRLGADLADSDSDDDGLTDKEEVDGWTFPQDAAGILSHVTSDPLLRDTDGDGINDLAERTLLLSAPDEYPFHPRVWKASPVGLYTELGDEDGFVYPGQAFAYTATVRNNFGLPLYAHGDLAAGFPEVLGVSQDTTVSGPSVRAIAVNGDDVYVGGEFTAAGGVTATHVALWDQSAGTWSPLGLGVNGPVHAIALSGDDVYVGGEFTSAQDADGPVSADSMARWNSTLENWTGFHVTGTVHALAANAIGDLYAGGEFSAAGGVTATNVVRLSGQDWLTLTIGVNAPVQALAANGSQVLVGGSFSAAGGEAVQNLAGWNDLLGRWAWPDQVFFTLFQDESVSLTRDLTADPSAETQVTSIDNAQRSQFNATGYASAWDWEARRESAWPLASGRHPWHTAVAPLPGAASYRVAALVGDAPGSAYALRLDGVDDHVDLPDNFASVTDLTFSAWVYWQGGGVWQRVFDWGQDTNLNVFLTPQSNDNRLRFAITTGGSAAEQRLHANPLPTNQWTHLAVTLAGDVGTLYVNGIAVDSQAITLDPQDVVGVNAWLGRSQYPADPYFNGRLDEVRVWDVARMGVEIRADMNRALSGHEVGLIAYWRLDEGAGSTAHDQTAHGNDAVLVPVSIDADLPTTSTLTSLTDGQYIRYNPAQDILTIGGIAHDADSGVDHVEVEADGAWQPATGAASWAYNWQVPSSEGSHTLRTRATDDVGNRTPDGALVGIDIRVDAAPPVAALTHTGPSSAAITQALTLRGIVTDTVGDHTTARGLAGLDIAFVPADTDLDLGDWDAAYYNTADLSGPIMLSRTDPAIDFDWGYGSPHPVIVTGTFSAHWEQEATFKAAGMYRFETYHDNGVRVYVDGDPVLDAWAEQWDAAHVADTYVSTGTHTLRVEYSHKSPLNLGGVPVSQPAVVRLAISLLELDPGWTAATLAQSGSGVVTSTWTHPVPAGLDGVYQIALRGSDVFDNRAGQSTWDHWQGEIDTLAPRVSIEAQLLGSGASERTTYTCQAEDFNLVEEGFECPCPGQPERRYYDTAWWRTWVSDTTRLYGLSVTCIVAGHQSSEATVRACDRYAHCDQASTMPAASRGVNETTEWLEAFIFTPTHGILLTTTAPISVAGAAYSQGGGYNLGTLTVTVDGALVYTHTTWSPPDNAAWATTWTPDADGARTLLAEVSDTGDRTPENLHPISITVDTLAPEIAVPAAVLTTAQRLSFARVTLTGPYTETGGVAAIRARSDAPGPGTGDWFDVAPFDDPSTGPGQTWRYAWYLDVDEEPDGETYNVTVVITDVAGRSAQDTGAILIDLLPPEPVTVTLAYTNSQGLLAELAPGQTIRDVLSPTLAVSWTASSSGDLSRYYAGWTGSETPALSTLTAYAPAATRRHAQEVGDVQALYAHVVAQDALGNRQWHTLGPVYTDGPATPDYVSDLAYHVWTESGCTQVGADRELARNAYRGQVLTGTQRFYATWDAEALRLAWSGANWEGDGDLFIYLDTGAPGGATAAYNPYSATMTNTVVGLPAQDGHQLAADYLLWIEDAHTVALMRWDGGDWGFVDPPFPIDNYGLDTTTSPPSTDLYVPFSLLGISDPANAALWLVALASEEETLRLWAAMPEKNPLNSERVVNAPGVVGASQHFTLTQGYEWTSLGAELCPNAGQFTDADLLVDVTADPPGVEVGYLEHDLLYLNPGVPLDADLDGEPDRDLPLDTDPSLVGQGQVITYTLHYANAGTEIAPGVRVTLTALGALSFGGSDTVVRYLDVGAGLTTTLQVTGTVNTSVYTRSVEVDAVVADDIHGPFDWLWVQHDVDTAAPEDLAIAAPRRYIKPFTNTVRGTVYDPSGVPTVTLAWQELPGGTGEISCPDDTPDDGQWTCAWNVGDVDSGQFRLRARATDRFGNAGGWSAPVTLTVDASPPTISLDAEAEQALQGAVLGPQDALVLSGEVRDDQQAYAAQVCFAQTYGQYCEHIPVYPGNAISGTWSYALGAMGELDNELQTFSLYGVDGAGNRSTAPLSRTYGVDTVAPAVTVTTWVDYLPSPTPTLVLGGTVSDGSGVEEIEMYVSVETPQGDVSWNPVARVGDAWSYTLHPQTDGTFSLRVRARDPKGNTTELGPFEVFVGLGKVYLPLVLKNH